MVITLMLETDEAKAAATAARSQEDMLLLVPRVGSRYAAVGTVAKIEDSGQLANGMEALVIRGLHRSVVGTGVAGTGDATWVQVEDAPETNTNTPPRKGPPGDSPPPPGKTARAPGGPQGPGFLAGSPTP